MENMVGNWRVSLRMQGHNMSDDIRSILERMSMLEASISPETVKSGLDAQQRGVPESPALFKPKNISTVLTARTDPEHPMAGYEVGESAEMAEDVLTTVKKGLTDYLGQIEDEINRKKDGELANKADPKDISSKKKDKDLTIKIVATEDPTEEETPVPTDVHTAVTDPTLPESHPVKSMALEDGRICEIHGNEHDGFHIRHGAKAMPSHFADMAQAEMALEMFKSRQRQSLESADYLEEK